MKFESRYSIRDLEKLSGIKAHTLRIWEKRYSLFEPERTKTNIRHYSNDDLKKILNISQLNKSGIKISKIAEMSDDEINEKISALSIVRTENEDFIDSLIVAMIELNEVSIEKVFSNSILRIGFEKTILDVIFPFFHRIGLMWQSGGINPAQEHFVSNIVRQKLIVAIDGLKQNTDKKAPAALLFLPESELHELSLLFYHYALKARNYKTIYLGQAVPVSDLTRIVEITRPDYIVCIATVPLPKKGMQRLVESLSHLKDAKKILVSGREFLNYKKALPSRFKVFRDLKEFLSGL